MWIDPKDHKPDDGDIFIMLFTDGSGAKMMFKNRWGYYDEDGSLNDEGWRGTWGKWCRVPKDHAAYEFWIKDID